MPQAPLPRDMARLLTTAGTANRSLVFERGFDRYDDDWKVLRADAEPSGLDGKTAFLKAFLDAFREPPGFRERMGRRQRSLQDKGATLVRLRTATRLVVGLGLPHPGETGFLLDRLTGSPYLPGSSVKGLLRAAARLVAQGELPAEMLPEGHRSFFRQHLDRLFGPLLEAGTIPARGELVVYDAFPTRWPKLELDGLTPHHGDYYQPGSQTVPGDWHQPVPVSFLTVKADTEICFALRGLSRKTAGDDVAKVEALLPVALDWLGIGAKTSSGYGLFEGPGGGNGAPGKTWWRGVRLYYVPGTRQLVASHGHDRAKSEDLDLLAGLPEEARKRLTRKRNARPLTCDLQVLPRPDGWIEIVAVSTKQSKEVKG